MGYTFVCDDCDKRFSKAPAFMGEFRESFLKTSDSMLTELFRPGQTVTICRSCMEDRLL